MILRRRVQTIYKKELIDILRDRRTLIAMIVVPIVLYPLLMLGSVQAVSFQGDTLEREKFLVGVVSDAHWELLERLIRSDAQRLEQARQESAEDPEDGDGPVGLVDLAESPSPYPDRQALEQAVKDREVQVGVIFEHEELRNGFNTRNPVTILADREEVRSANAAGRLRRMIGRTGERIIERRLTDLDLPPEFVTPFSIAFVNLSARSSILGQILPLILILMTITGAIYPAIDLTAGERERGTLESLMVSPVPVFELIVGKFLVVTTVAIMGATLNLASVTATMWFGGFDVIVADTEGGLPIGKMVIILLCLVPFAVLMSAIMIAVCSYARTFKEAQNYVTPVIMAVLIPGGIAAMPAARLDGVMLVIPVGNMVLFAREMLLGAPVSWWQMATVLVSTSLYAAAAVSIAATVFGRESVVFADAGSLRTSFSRRLIKPSRRPTITLSLLFVAFLFPTWFFIQASLAPGPGEDAQALLAATAWLMPLMFVALPVVVLFYWRISLTETLSLRMPRRWHLVAGLLIGLSAWVPAHELNVLQSYVLGPPASLAQSAELLGETLSRMHPAKVLLIIAIIPAVCEELLFRGLLLSGLGTSSRKYTAIIVSAVVFGVFHFLLPKFAVTVALGLVLGYLCWQSRSIVPGMLAHALHNGVAAMSVLLPKWSNGLGIPADLGWSHFPPQVIVGGLALFVAGCLLARIKASPHSDQQ